MSGCPWWPTPPASRPPSPDCVVLQGRTKEKWQSPGRALPVALPFIDDVRSEQILYLGINRHACRCDYAGDMGNWISRSIIGIQSERSRIVFSVGTQSDLFN